MANRGINETSQLKDKLLQQEERLLTQLQDLHDCREDLDEEEYHVSKSETEDQLAEVRTSLSKLRSGDMTLIDAANQSQLSIQSAISAAFRTPEVRAMFTSRQPSQLRQRLLQVDRDLKIKLLTPSSAQEQRLEILSALKRLGDKLSPEEQDFLDQYSSQSLRHLEQVSDASLHQALLSSLTDK